ncbi:hypothetical protein [Gracilimonas mengyeensis]|uniref:DUF4440 domain-containing protein n=1 Tax=Gracilimonas mengyeensis TaxID=1302730 RepID=A0A521ESU9_9BACT|nr:hypothetical protein [Gracilimonas mengyeensis]SMO86987.1 hypothetical protein SAMN06265219_113117 [Gracilimonas mengyeensis]
MKHFLSIILFLTLSISSLAQQQTDAPVKSIDGIIDELLDQITIEKGEKMDTTAIRNLFHPSAIFTVADSEKAETISLDDFLTLLKDPYYEQGYLEKEIHKVVDEYNGIAQVFQSFYGKDSEGAEERGINSYQLTYYGDRWWIVSLLWTIESESVGIPVKYGGE